MPIALLFTKEHALYMFFDSKDEKKYWHIYQFPVATVTSYHNNVTVNNRNLFFHKSGGQKSKISSTELKSDIGTVLLCLEVLGENPSLASSSFWWLLKFLGLWPHHCNICLHCYIALFFSVCGKISPCLCDTKTHVITFKTHLDNLGKYPHCKTLNHICEDPFPPT